MRNSQAALLLLAGGASRRMGQPKALLEVAGRTLIEFVAARLPFEELLVSAPADLALPRSLASRARVVHDRYPAAGPLAGIDAGLTAATAPVVLVAGCDMPYVTIATARRLVAAAAGHGAAVPVVDGRSEPVFAAYSRSAAGAIASALAAGRHRARDVLDELDVAWLTDIDPAELRSLNTAIDYAAFLDALR